MTNVLEVMGVTVRRGETTMLDAVSMDISAGEVIGLIGPNGAGKSTLMNIMAGDLAPDTGTARLHGKDISAYSMGELARHRAVLPQQTLLQFGFRVHEVVAMGRLPLPPCGAQEELAAIDRTLEQTDTVHLRERIYPKLSGGEQSRVSFSRVLAQEAPVVLLDEPTASLDIRHQHDVMHIARKIARQGGTVIAILHDLNLAMSYTDRIGLLDHGQLAAYGTPWDIVRSDVLSHVFSCPLVVIPHPGGLQPLIVPLGGNHHGDEPALTPNSDHKFASPSRT